MATTWNPSDKSTYIDLSNGNLTAAGNNTSHGGMVRANAGKSSGKWYFEAKINTGLYDQIAISIGVANSTASLNFSSNSIGESANGWSYNGWSGKKENGAGTIVYGATYTTGDIIGVAMNMDDHILTFYKNGASQGSAFTNLSGTLYPAVGPYKQPGYDAIVTGNFGATSFSYAIPSGYTRFDPLVFCPPIMIF